MSLITCCPACGTMFKVVADQLKISEGWVRCGHCAHVFDATAHMVDGAQPTAAVPAPEEALVSELAHAPVAAPPPAPVFEPRPEPVSELPSESPLDQPFIFRRSDLAGADDLPSVSPPLAASEPEEDEPAPPAEHEDVGFLRQARRRAYWRRPLVRVLLVLLLLALSAALLLQVAVHDRDRLAAAQPQLRPWLEMLCEPLQCRIGPPRQIEAIAIDSSSFNKLRNDTYRLSFTLKNSAGTPVATPSMELTLTDTQDQAVVRRVLSPSELGAPSAVIAAGSEWSGSVALAVAANGNGRISGYRLLAFYP
jgi:predicted Zn finger-like uncharacterized protein